MQELVEWVAWFAMVAVVTLALDRAGMALRRWAERRQRASRRLRIDRSSAPRFRVVDGGNRHDLRRLVRRVAPRPEGARRSS